MKVMNKPNKIIWHHSADVYNGHQAGKINKYHESRHFPQSSLGYFGGYHILIEKDGTMFRYRRDDEFGAHDKDENINSLGVCLVGNFSIEKPTEKQEKMLIFCLDEWFRLYNLTLSNVEPHRKNDATECPGLLLADDWVMSLYEKRIKNIMKETLEDIIKYIQSKI